MKDLEKPKRLNRAMKILERLFLHTATFLTLTVALAVAFLLFYPYKTYVVTESPRTLKDTYYPGEVIEYTLKACFYRPVTYELSTQLVDGFTYPYPTETIHREPGCRTIDKKNIIVPLTQAKGQYHLEFNVRIQVNIIRTEDAYYATNNFTILPLPEVPKSTPVSEGISQDLARDIIKKSSQVQVKPDQQPQVVQIQNEVPKQEQVELAPTVDVDSPPKQKSFQLNLAGTHE